MNKTFNIGVGAIFALILLGLVIVSLYARDISKSIVVPIEKESKVIVLNKTYTPITPTHVRNQFIVKIIIIPHSDVGRICSEMGATPHPAKIRGCSVFNEQRNFLTMWVTEPRYVEDQERFSYIGHELWHGARGRFHPE